MKKHKISVPTALMLMLLAVVCTFNITFFAATTKNFSRSISKGLHCFC